MDDFFAPEMPENDQRAATHQPVHTSHLPFSLLRRIPGLLTNWWCKRTSVANSPAAMTRKHFFKRLQALLTAGEWKPSIDLSYTRNSALSYSIVSLGGAE